MNTFVHIQCLKIWGQKSACLFLSPWCQRRKPGTMSLSLDAHKARMIAFVMLIFSCFQPTTPYIWGPSSCSSLSVTRNHFCNTPPYYFCKSYSLRNSGRSSSTPVYITGCRCTHELCMLRKNCSVKCPL